MVCALPAAGCVRAPATAPRGNSLKSLEIAPDSLDLHTFPFVQLQQALNVYGIKDFWHLRTFFVQVVPGISGESGPAGVQARGKREKIDLLTVAEPAGLGSKS